MIQAYLFWGVVFKDFKNLTGLEDLFDGIGGKSTNEKKTNELKEAYESKQVER